MRTALTALFAASLLLAVTACSHAAGESPGVGDKLVNVPLKTLSGKDTTLAKLVKGRVTCFKFGATWCPPCKKQMFEMDKLLKEYGKKVVIFDIDIREPAAKVKKYHHDNGFQIPSVLDPTGEAAQRYQVKGIPTVFVADHNAKILHRGFTIPAEQLKPIIDKALAAAAEAEKK
jgi:thiol-disulfide isomerase/thioredoxin